MKSIIQMLEQCAGLVDTIDVTPWENSFIKSVLEQTGQGKDTTRLSPKQIGVIERIYDKHFA